VTGKHKVRGYCTEGSKKETHVTKSTGNPSLNRAKGDVKKASSEGATFQNPPVGRTPRRAVEETHVSVELLFGGVTAS